MHAACGPLPIRNPASAGFFVSQTRFAVRPRGAVERGPASLVNMQA